MDIEVFQADSSGADLRIALVQSRFNEPICNSLREACLKELVKQGVDSDDIFAFSVPGALELGSALEKLASSKQFDALIAIGAVVRGETYHFEIVAGESARGIMALTMDGMAIGNGILTVENEGQALVRADASQKDKGGEAAKAALAMLDLQAKFLA